MARPFPILLTVTLLSLGVWQYVRLFQYEKDVHYHHYDKCKRFEVGLEIVDMTRFGDVTLAITANGLLYSLNGLAYARPNFEKVPITGTPSGFHMHPLGFFMSKNTTLYVLSEVNTESQVLVFEIDEMSDGAITAWFNRTIELPASVQGTTTDLIISDDTDMHLAQTYAVPATSSPVTQVQNLAYEILGVEATYVHHCDLTVSPVTCRVLENTKGVSVRGITMSKFGVYFVSYSTADENWVNVYEKKRNGDLKFTQKIPLRDRTGKIDYDGLHQRTYAGAVPYPYAAPGASGVTELSNWDLRSYHTYRSLIMQDGGLLKGATCAARGGTNIMLASLEERAVLVCPIYAPFI